jgi:Zn-dependent peptidase ImmA (M78 family)
MVKVVEKFIREFHGWSFPIDPEKICKNLNISLESVELPENIKGYFNKTQNKIIINSKLAHHSARFITAREIRQAIYPENKSLKDKNLFASELLIPTNEFIKIWNANYPVQIMECAYYFDVGYDSITIKAKKLYEAGKINSGTYSLFTNIFGD